MVHKSVTFYSWAFKKKRKFIFSKAATLSCIKEKYYIFLLSKKEKIYISKDIAITSINTISKS